MALTPAEAKELAELEKRFGSAPAASGAGGLSSSEQAELAELEKRFGAAPAQITDNDFVNEMHPDISAKDRLIIKNFGNDAKAGEKLLRQSLPNHEIRHQDGQYFVRKTGEEKFRVLDPSGFSFRDLPADIGDLGYDVAAAAADSAAVAGGAALGGLPGAVGAGAAAGAGTEALRQKLGQMLGLDQQLDGTDIAVSGALGGATTGLFGGGTAKGLASKGYQSAKQSALPWIGEKLSGKTADSIRALAKNLPTIEQMEAGGFRDQVKRAHEKISGGIRGKLTSSGKALETAEAAAENVDLTQAKQSFMDRINDLIANNTGSDASEAAIREATAQAEQLILKEPDLVTGPQARMIRDRLEEVAKSHQISGGVGKSVSTGVAPVDRQMTHLARDAKGSINDAVDAATGNATSPLRKQYSELAGIQDELSKPFKSPAKTYKTLSTLDRPQNADMAAQIKELAKKHGIDMNDEAALFNAYRSFNKDAMKNTSRNSIPLSIVGAGAGYYAGANSGIGQGGAGVGAAAGGLLGAVLGGPRAIRAAIKAGRMTEQVAAKATAPLIPLAPAAPGAMIEGGKSVWDSIRRDAEEN